MSESSTKTADTRTGVHLIGRDDIVMYSGKVASYAMYKGKHFKVLNNCANRVGDESCISCVEVKDGEEQGSNISLPRDQVTVIKKATQHSA